MPPVARSIIGLAPGVAIVASLGVIVADPARNFVLSIVVLGVVTTLLAVLAIHRQVTRRLGAALAAAEAEVAAQAQIRHAAQIERTALEEQLLQAQKMEAIGQLASGLAHDFNNTLMVAGGYADLLYAEAPSARLRAYSEAIAQRMERGTELTRQLLAFARPTASRTQPIDVRPIVTGIIPLIRRLLGSRIEVGVEIPERPMIARFDPAQLEHALINLAINSRDAMPAGGRLTVVVNAGLPEFVEIAVRDSGSGIPTEHLDRIFEPFFTTKRAGHGSGLGLPMVSRFASHAGGDVTVESAPGVGTTIAIRLPMTEAAARPAAREDRQPRLADHRGSRPGLSRRADRLAAGSGV